MLLARHVPSFAGFPRMVLVINYFLSAVFVALFRLSKRMYLETWKKPNGSAWQEEEAVLEAGTMGVRGRFSS